LLPNKGQQTAQGKADVRNHGRRLLVRPWDTKMSGLLPRSSVVVTWKAGCGESRTSGLEWGKDREVLPITTGEVVISPCYPASGASGSLVSERRGGPHGRRRGGGVAPMPIRKPDAPVVTDPAAVAHGVVARKRLSVSNLPTIPSTDLIG